MAFYPKVSIIIATKNAKNNLHETLESIRLQQYPCLEVVVIDGGSTDGSLEIIKAYSDIIKILISEPDQGISDAFNKGLGKATGEYINFQGAGDTLATANSLTQLFEGLDPSYALICGKVIRVQEDGHTPIWEAPRQVGFFKPRTLLFKMGLPHQALFTHRKFFDTFGSFDLSCRFAMDYELLLRAYRQFPKTIIKDVVISHWRAGGIGHNRIYEVLDEYHRIKQQHRIAPASVLAAINQLNRLKYQLKTKWLNCPY